MHLLRVPAKSRCSPPLRNVTLGEFACNPADRSALREPAKNLPNMRGFLLADFHSLLRLRTTPSELFRPVGVQVVRFVAIREITGTAVGFDPSLLTPMHPMPQITDCLSMVQLKDFHFQLPPVSDRVDAFPGRDEPPIRIDQVFNERISIRRPAQPRLIIHGQDRDLTFCNHVAQLTKPIAFGMRTRLSLIVDHDNVVAFIGDNPSPCKRRTHRPFLVAAALRPLHVRRIATINDNLLGNHGNSPHQG